MKKLVIITSHPIQYNSPVFELLAKQCNLLVLYTLGEQKNYDLGFKRTIEWDLPLLEGYEFEFLENNAKQPGSHHFKGIDNPTLIYKVKAFKPDAILIYGWSYKSHLKAMRHFKGKIPIWFRGDSNLLDEKSALKKQLRHLFLKWLYTHIDKAFYVGTANKAYYEAFGLKQTQLVFAPHAIDNDRFKAFRLAEVHKLRNNLDIKDTEVLITFAGKFEHKKDPELLLSAFKEQKKSDVHLLFVGNGELKTTLEAKVNSFPTSIKERVHFMDFQNQTQMPVIYQACDLFCLPSKGPGETWGLAVNEAMAAGKAVLVSSKVGCSKDLVKNGTNGYIFEAENKDDLVEKLEELTNNQTVLTKMGAQSSKIIEKWTIEKQSQIIVNELNGIN
ncbi:glycosyltransferase family 4 protein [Pedobacter sp. Du54]|uniref:glycosyltransferase family 4 protein n=1 Tax=Pedobacter anseongensis TaxID=3133439 RepID=UPI0030A44AAD